MKSSYQKLQSVLLCLGLGIAAQGCALDVAKDESGKPGSHPNPVTLVRKYQHVQRYNCNGTLRDDGIESTQEPTEWRSLSVDSSPSVDSLSMRNRSNGDTANPVIWNGRTAKFLIKFNTGEGGLKVERGLNIADYTFSNAGAAVETGTISFDVTYTVETVPGTKVVQLPCPAPSASP
jgi:hypothetical protein